jgi:hypothetical protein
VTLQQYKLHLEKDGGPHAAAMKKERNRVNSTLVDLRVKQREEQKKTEEDAGVRRKDEKEDIIGSKHCKTTGRDGAVSEQNPLDFSEDTPEEMQDDDDLNPGEFMTLDEVGEVEEEMDSPRGDTKADEDNPPPETKKHTAASAAKDSKRAPSSSREKLADHRSKKDRASSSAMSLKKSSGGSASSAMSLKKSSGSASRSSNGRKRSTASDGAKSESTPEAKRKRVTVTPPTDERKDSAVASKNGKSKQGFSAAAAAANKRKATSSAGKTKDEVALPTPGTPAAAPTREPDNVWDLVDWSADELQNYFCQPYI